GPGPCRVQGDGSAGPELAGLGVAECGVDHGRRTVAGAGIDGEGAARDVVDPYLTGGEGGGDARLTGQAGERDRARQDAAARRGTAEHAQRFEGDVLQVDAGVAGAEGRDTPAQRRDLLP